MIQAKINLHSVNNRGQELITLEVVMPRYILAEFNTHRMLSKNSASSRAIPFNKMVQSVRDNPFIPYAWQKDHKGMQGTEYWEDETFIAKNNGTMLYTTAHRQIWIDASEAAIEASTILNGVGNVTKQLANRLLEPFMYHKVLVSGTEWKNFFNLRCPSYTFHNDDSENNFVYKSRKEAIKDLGADNPVEFNSGTVPLGELTTLQWLSVNTGQADIHMMALAECIYDAIKESTPTKLKDGEWHIPFGDNIDINEVMLITPKPSGRVHPEENTSALESEWYSEVYDNIIKISIARCARLSYQTLGDNPTINYEKDLELYEILSKSGHWSPFEHVAKAMTESEYNDYTRTKPEYDYEENYYRGKKVEKGWCRNYRGFIQYRELLD